MAQSSITDEEITDRTRLRLLHLGKLARNGALGKLVSGEEYDGFKVEGLRTELPFYISLAHNPESLHRTIWTPRGRQIKAVIESINAIFDGRADLVLALRDKESQGWLQVVDAKTKQCLGGFNPSNPLEGNELQMSLSEKSPHASSPSEEAIIAEHRLQLTLYSLALELSEAKKPETERRKILPPAIQISASGRMVRMTDEDYKKARLDLDELIRWIGETEALEEDVSAPRRLPVEQSSTCGSCPYYSGSIKLCGPEGERLGPA